MGRLNRPDLDTAEIVRRYTAGEASTSIAADLRCCTRTVRLRLTVAGVPMRPQGKVKSFSSGHGHNWKGDRASYVAFHARVVQRHGRPNRCDVCGNSARRTYHWANLTGNYPDPADYARMCVPCHKRFDLARLKVKSYAESPIQPAGDAALAELERQINLVRAGQGRDWATTVNGTRAERLAGEA